MQRLPCDAAVMAAASSGELGAVERRDIFQASFLPQR